MSIPLERDWRRNLDLQLEKCLREVPIKTNYRGGISPEMHERQWQTWANFFLPLFYLPHSNERTEYLCTLIEELTPLQLCHLLEALDRFQDSNDFVQDQITSMRDRFFQEVIGELIGGRYLPEDVRSLRALLGQSFAHLREKLPK
jgi:hypothetical protein